MYDDDEPATQPPAAMPESRAPLHGTRARPRELAFHGRDDWQAGLREHLLPLQCIPVDAPGFKGRAVVARCGGITMAELRVDASRLLRRELELVDGQVDHLQLVWQLAGRSRIGQGPNQATLEVGTWTICDAGRSYVLDLEHGARCLLVLVPRARCTGWLNGLAEVAALALSSTGPAQVALAMLVALLREGGELEGRSKLALLDALVALIEGALSVELEHRGLSPLSARPAAFARMQAYVMNHLGDKTLTVGRVAEVFGMSRRSLYNVFAPAGITPHSFIQQAKLDRARALLRDPDWRREPIARIAEQCGFADAAHFSRAFHARHGAAPNAWRDSPD